MERTRTAGGIVLGDGGTIAMVSRGAPSNLWLFPKGHIESTETDEEAARREVSEETGLKELELIDDLGTYERHGILKDGNDNQMELKTIHMFLFAAPPHATLMPSMEITLAKWVPFREVADTIGNPKDRAWFSSVFDRVREAIQRD